MKLRRALATAAVTAAIAPAALLAAPAAYAAQEAAAAPAGSVNAGTSGDTAPATSEDSSAGKAKDSSAAPAAGKVTVVPVPAADDKNLACKKQADEKEKSRATTDLTGYPAKVVAGSGWHQFKLRTDNSSNDPLKSTCLRVETATSRVSTPGGTDSTEFVTLEWRDPETKAWQKLPNSTDNSAYFAEVQNLPGLRHLDIDLRLKVDDKAKAGLASMSHTGIFVDRDGVCGKTEAKNAESFEILPAGTKLDETNHSKSPSPSPSHSKDGAKSSASPSASASASAKAGSSARPSASASASSSTGTTGTTTTSGGTTTGGSGTSAQGSLSNTSANSELAKTGSSSSTPVIAGLAGAAVVAGGAAVAVTRRRKNNT
ncbi:LPXTG cell wall anchor domain-containing protein [Streptomyces sp. HU2014]|uniref:LAETG motif-containing sortase-dependent surface protein n=1 Tax=Streptomyces sp. HU2014 TaxID=2939414 RepID=UPI00200EC271|nr:LAETG motif-containing sortase-dependent surface protein [Streptomyces sp. HU2014]UQI48323.1 LPXTG cell wall anchor domain-containing protein [Streptomyces sp. HU2014]